MGWGIATTHVWLSQQSAFKNWAPERKLGEKGKEGDAGRKKLEPPPLGSNFEFAYVA